MVDQPGVEIRDSDLEFDDRDRSAVVAKSEKVRKEETRQYALDVASRLQLTTVDDLLAAAEKITAYLEDKPKTNGLDKP
jgi:hypothetical protein